MMAVTFWNRPWACSLVAGALLALTLQAGQPRFARLGSFEGPVEVQLDPAESWRPAIPNLPLPEATRIRTGPAAKLEIELDDTSVFRMSGEGLAELSDYTRLSGGQRITVISLDHGVGYFTGEPGPGNAIHLLVPGAQASLKQGSRIRVVSFGEASEIAVIEGSARFTIPSTEMDLHQGQSVRVTYPESSHFSLFREIAPLDSDGWNEQLDKTEPDAPASRLDLDRAGKWITAGDYGTVWQPAPQAGWAPFRQGRWLWFQSVGFTWVGAEPWGWTPYHQGRWLQHPDLGWVWLPDARPADFSPGPVFWARTANLSLWGALAPGEQWNGAGPPRQFAALNVTGGPLVSGAREILPAPTEDLPKDLLKTFLFTAALPSPALPSSRLTVAREALRTRPFAPVDVAPLVPEVTEAPPAPPEPEAPPVVTETAMVSANPVIVGDPPVADAPSGPNVPGVIVITKPHSKALPPASIAAGNYRNVRLSGAGATNPAGLYLQWFKEFKEAQIDYQAIGSGGGLRNLTEGKVDFAGSDTPMLDPKRPDSTSTPFYFPMAVAGVAVVYNVPGANEYLNLTQDVLAGIFLGQISYWNDPRIVALNPRSSLPPTEIVLVHRSDASATTFTLSDYLAKVSPAWRQHAGSGASVNWPTRGLAGVGNDGVAKLIHDTAYSIGYVDVTYATTNRLAMAAIKNRAGYFVFAQAGNLTAAAGTIDGGLPDDFRTSITDSPAAEAYPIASFTYILTPRRFSDPGKRAAISDLLTWAITTGQKDNVNQGFAPLPQDMIKRERRQIGLIK